MEGTCHRPHVSLIFITNLRKVLDSVVDFLGIIILILRFLLMILSLKRVFDIPLSYNTDQYFDWPFQINLLIVLDLIGFDYIFLLTKNSVTVIL